MDAQPQQQSLSPLDALRAMRLWTFRDGLASVYWAVTEGAFRTGYALHLGASEALIGLLSAAPSCAQMLQMFSPLFIERLKRRKPLSMACFGVSYAMWVPIALIPFMFPHDARPWAMIVMVGFAGAAFAIASPATTSWFTDVVPAEMRGRFVGRLHTVVAGVGLGASLLAGQYMDLFPESNKQSGFLSLFLIAAAFAVAAVVSWAWVPEPPKRAAEPGPVAQFLSLPFRHANFRHFMTFACARATAVMVAGPFFTVYMLKTLRMSYVEIAIYSALATISAMVANPLWGYLSDKFGHRPVLRISSFAICLIPLLWFFVTRRNYPYSLPIIQVWAGTMSAGLILSQFNLMVKIAPEENRSVYFGMYAALVSGASAIGAMIGGGLAGLFSHVGGLEWFGGPITNIQAVFLVSGLLRISSQPLLASVKEEPAVAAAVVMRQVRSGRPFMTLWSLLRMARSADPVQKAQAAEALGSTGSLLAVDELVGLLDDSDRAVRREAAKALGEIGDLRAVQALIASARDPLADVVEQAIEALGRIPAAESLDALLELLHDERPSVRKTAALALGNLRQARAKAPLEERLDQERDLTVFLATAEALGKLGSARALHRLRPLLRSSPPGLARKQAANAIGDILGSPGVFYPLLQAREMRQEELVARSFRRTQRRLRPRRADSGQGQTFDASRLDNALADFVQHHHAEAVAGIHSVASSAVQRFAATRAAQAKPPRGSQADLTVGKQVALLLDAHDRLRLSFGCISGLHRDARRRELHLEEALLAVFALEQLADELRRLRRQAPGVRPTL